MQIDYRPFTMQDFDDAYALWKRTEGMGLSCSDGPTAIERFLVRNPGLSFVASLEGRLVGTLIAGHDGRRGYLYHLAVGEDVRGQGIGRELVSRVLAELKAQGIDKAHLFVFGDNESGKAFWRKVGWTERIDLVVMSSDACSGSC